MNRTQFRKGEPPPTADEMNAIAAKRGMASFRTLPMKVTLSGSANPYSWTENDGTRAGAGDAFELNDKTGLDGREAMLYAAPAGWNYFRCKVGEPPCLGTIVVQIRTCSDAGLSGQSITLTQSGGATWSDTALTDGSGNVTFTVPNIPGNYAVSHSIAGYISPLPLVILDECGETATVTVRPIITVAATVISSGSGFRSFTFTLASPAGVVLSGPLTFSGVGQSRPITFGPIAWLPEYNGVWTLTVTPFSGPVRTATVTVTCPPGSGQPPFGMGAVTV